MNKIISSVKSKLKQNIKHVKYSISNSQVQVNYKLGKKYIRFFNELILQKCPVFTAVSNKLSNIHYNKPMLLNF